MSNEAITEELVRTHFKNDAIFDSIRLEEKITRQEPARNCLKRASKKENKKPGYPDFVISIPALPDEIIVIECKADSVRHQSRDIDKPLDYAVDGALHYARFLSSDYNVLAIGVSGQDVEELKVSSFFIPKGGERPQVLNDGLLSIYSYIEFFKDDKFASQIEFQKIVKTAISVNSTLNNYSVPEHERGSIVGGILLALKSEAFAESFGRTARTKDGKPRPDRLAKAIIDAVEDVLQDEGIEKERAEIMRSEFASLRTHSFAKNDQIRKINSSEIEPNFVLRDLTRKLAQDILPLMKSGKRGFDVLGRFYTEFVRYSGTDKKTGLVLTPQHITEFFCELVDLNENDVVLDTCCGSGGFLISAMKYLSNLVGNDAEKREAIYSNQIVGVEDRSDMFTVACSNMIMSGDGKSSIYFGDSFIPPARNAVLKHKPTVAFLNPPYHVSDERQLEFVLNALDILQEGGRCAAIVQISCAISIDKEVVKVKEKLFKSHTLQAVLSMPVDLFFQKAGVVTCVMLWEAKRPHPKTLKTFLGYCRDDGHEKTKTRGRIDDGSWVSKKSEWIDFIRNKENRTEMAICQRLSETDEWVAEAYLETDYSKLDATEFENALKDFIVFRSLGQ